MKTIYKASHSREDSRFFRRLGGLTLYKHGSPRRTGGGFRLSTMAKALPNFFGSPRSFPTAKSD